MNTGLGLRISLTLLLAAAFSFAGGGCPSSRPDNNGADNPGAAVGGNGTDDAGSDGTEVEPEPQPQSGSSAATTPPPPPEEPPSDSPGPVFTEPAVIPDQKAERQSRTYVFSGEETSYVWTEYCDGQRQPPQEDPFGAPDAETLLITYDTWDSYRHLALLRLPLHLIPQRMEKVSLEIFCSQDGGEEMDVEVHRIDEPWTWPAQDDSWQAICWDSFPSITWTDGVWHGDNTPHTDQWFQIDITDTYKYWTDEWYGPKPNYGMAVRSDSYQTWAEFYSSNYRANPELRPRVVMEYYPPVPRRLVFPLAGKYSPDRVRGGYRFGDWWENQTCLNLDAALLHTGTDFAAQAGDRVSAASTGKVKLARTDQTWGGYVVVECRDKDANGDDFFYTFTYTHVTPDANLVLGEWVSQGDQLGTVSDISSAHLHLQVRVARYDERWSIIGRLPLISCTTDKSPDEPEPAFPHGFFDPEYLDWE